MHIKVRVRTGAKNENVCKVSANHFEISVREKAKENMANSRVLVLIARELGIPVAKVRISKGHHRPSKILSVDSSS